MRAGAGEQCEGREVHPDPNPNPNQEGPESAGRRLDELAELAEAAEAAAGAEAAAAGAAAAEEAEAAEALGAQLFSPSAPRPSTSPSTSDASEVFFSPSESVPDPESPPRALASQTVRT